MDPISRILFKRLTGAALSEEERAALEAWIAQDGHNEEAARRLADLEHLQKEYRLRSLVDPEKALADMRARIAALPAVRRRRRLRAAAAVAAIVIAGGLGSLFLNRQAAVAPGPVAEVTATAIPVIEISDIRHGQTKATLTDKSGHSLALTDTGKTEAAEKYLAMFAEPSKAEVEKLKLEVPRGGEFKVTLEDSTEVWLNSESTLRYPEVFGADERRVQVTGEAYFAVKSDPKRPFYVETGEQTVRVYGTCFNVRSYPDDPFVYTTLEQGSISITRRNIPSGEIMLSPGHQAMLSHNGESLDLRVVDPKVITGWRHGRFVFEEQPLSAIMKDLSRWYDFDYEFTDPEVEKIVFMGSIPRYADFATAIAIIEKSGGLRFSTEGDKVVIGRKGQPGRGMRPQKRQ